VALNNRPTICQIPMDMHREDLPSCCKSSRKESFCWQHHHTHWILSATLSHRAALLLSFLSVGFHCFWYLSNSQRGVNCQSELLKRDHFLLILPLILFCFQQATFIFSIMVSSKSLRSNGTVEDDITATGRRLTRKALSNQPSAHPPPLASSTSKSSKSTPVSLAAAKASTKTTPTATAKHLSPLKVVAAKSATPLLKSINKKTFIPKAASTIKKKPLPNSSSFQSPPPSQNIYSSDESMKEVATPTVGVPRAAGLLPTAMHRNVGSNLVSPYATPLARQPPPPPPPSLASFGIIAAPASTISAHRTNDRNSRLKCCVVMGYGNKYTVILRFEGNNPGSSWNCWAEKIASDALRDKKPWIVAYSFHDRCLHWYHHNLPQQNSRGFFIRLFVIYATGPPPPKDALIRLGNAVCEHVNNSPGNNTTTTLDPNDYFWGGDNAVWADVIGNNEALAALYRETEVTGPSTGYYEAYRDVILTYFHEDDIPWEIMAYQDPTTLPSMPLPQYYSMPLPSQLHTLRTNFNDIDVEGYEDDEDSVTKQDEKGNDEDDDGRAIKKGLTQKEEDEDDIRSYRKFNTKPKQRSYSLYDDSTDSNASTRSDNNN